jgi:hypothetical protein
LADGRVKILFSLFSQDKKHAALFTPKISAEVNSRFRWALPGEASALRISNEGAAHLNLWFKDDVEAEMGYTQANTSKKNQLAALVFTNVAGKSIGSNLGTQCALFDSAKPKGGRGEVETMRTFSFARIKLVVRNGIFEAHRNAEKRETMEYNQKSYASGRIGFIWAGDLASSIESLEITGRLDDKKMAELIRKGTRQ